MNGSAKGSFWDRIKIRFIKIIQKFKKRKKKLNKIPNDYYQERKLKKKKEEELYNYYKRENNKEKRNIFSRKVKLEDKKVKIVNNTFKEINKDKVKNINHNLVFNNKLKTNKNINVKNNNFKEVIKEKPIKLDKNKSKKIDNNIYTIPRNVPYSIGVKIEDKDMNKKKEVINSITNEIKQEKTNKTTPLNNNTTMKEVIPKNDKKEIKQNVNKDKKDIVIVNQNVNAFKKIDKEDKFSLQRENKFKEIKAPEVKPVENKIENIEQTNINVKEEVKESIKIKEVDLSKFNKVNNELDKKLEKQKEIYERLDKLVNNIEVEKKVDVKYHFISNLFSNVKNLFLSVLSIPLIKNPKNIPLFAVGIYMLNNSLRNMRKMVTKDERIRYIPSDIYTDAIKENLNNFELIDYMIGDSISQIRSLKSEYSYEFGQYQDNIEFKNIMEKLNNYENELIEKQKKMLREKEKMNNTLNKNNKKLQLIKDMNDYY